VTATEMSIASVTFAENVLTGAEQIRQYAAKGVNWWRRLQIIRSECGRAVAALGILNKD
jgi:hypothetical protein